MRAVVLAAVAVVVVVVGLAWQAHHDRLLRRRPSPVPADAPVVTLPAESLDTPPGQRATVVVVGTRGCSDCARTLALLRADLADRPGVSVAHVLAERVPELVSALDVRAAPTVLLAGADRRVVAQHPGAVAPDVVRAALDGLGSAPAAGATGSTRAPA